MKKRVFTTVYCLCIAAVLSLCMMICAILFMPSTTVFAAEDHSGHSGWKTLSGTLNATTLSGNYVLTGDVTLAGDIGSNGNTVICLNGHKIKGENHSIDGSDIVTTTICDCTGSGQIQNAELYNIANINDITLLACEIYATLRETYLNGVSVNEGAIKVANKTIYINGGCSIRGISINGTEGCIYTDGYLDCNIYVTERTDVYINGGTVNGSIVVGTSGLFPTGDLYISGGTVNSSITVNEGSLCDISGGTIKGSVTVNNGTCNINGGTINSPITVNDEATCNISGGTITTSQYYSSDPGEIKGAVVVNSGTCTIGGTALITGNRVDYGAAVVVNGGTCNINGDNIVGNNATYGGLYISGGTCKISSDAVIRENQSFTNGGGIYMVGGTCNNYGTISDNYTNTGNGGGIYMVGGTCKNELSSLLQGNKATSGNGGGIYIGGGNFNSQGTITGNTAANGGGVYLSGADQQIIISGTISNNIASSKGGGIYLCDGTSFRSGANFTENRTYGNGGGIYAEAGSYLEIVISTFTKNDASVQGGAIYLDGSSGNLCTAILTSCTFVTNTAGSNIITSNLYAVYSEISIDNNMLPYDQPSSLVLKNSSFTITKGKYETNKIGTCFDLQGDSEIILAGGYYSTDPAQLFTIADDVRVVQIDENSGDKNYDAAYPWALYTVDNYEIYIRGTAKNPVYDGQPIEKDTDFTLTLTYPKVNNFYYWYKDQGADDSTYVYGLPTDAGSYTIRAGGPYFESTTTIWFWECTFDITIAKADPSYTVPTNVIARVDTPLSAVQLPDGWTWQDGNIVPDTEGTQTYTAIYTPSDTVNYNIIEAEISVSVEHKHIGAKVEEVAATCTQNGVKAHYECSVCHELFEDSDCQTPIDDFDTWKVIPAIGHDFGDWTSNGDGTHTCTCQRDGCEETVTDNCSGGEATFFHPAICEVCGGEYIAQKIYKATIDFDGQTYYYETFGEAVDALGEFSTTAEKRAVLKLFDNIDLTSALTFNTGFITLDLNGYMLKQTGSGSVISIGEGADVVLDDWIGATTTHNYYVAEDGLWTFYDGDLPAEAAGAETGVVTGGIITGGSAVQGGVHVNGTFIMTGGTISGNSAYDSGGGVYVVNGGTFTMTGGTISGNTTVNYGGGGVNVSFGTFTMTGGTISDNTAKTFGGGVDVEFGTFTMTGGTISDNMATYFGSCVYKNGGTVSISGGYLDGTIDGSTVSISGGYFSEPPAEANIAENCDLYELTALGGAAFDSDYIEGYPYAVYVKGVISISTKDIVYDGSPVAEGVDFTVEGADGVALTYSYKAEGGDEFTAGLPTNAGEYAVSVYALNGKKQFLSVEFNITIAKDTPVYTTPTDLTICADHTLADIALPSGWTWKDSSVAVGEAGEKTFAAVFTPEDTLNYNTVEGSVTVTVTAHTGGTATCTHKAVCSVCGMEYGELAPHVFDQKVATAEYLASEATCTQKATYYYSCVCGEKDTETFEYGELAPHVFDQKVATAEYLASEATCTQKATYYYSCVCGEKGTETFEHGELAEHTAVEIHAVEATCTQSGMTAGSKCSVCGEILVAPEEIAPLGHIDENGDELCDRCGFDMSIPEFTIKVTGGTIEGVIGSTVIVEENGSVTVVASEAPEGKEFKGWSIDGGETIISAEAAYTFTASEDTVLTAVFADKQSDVKPGGEITPENPEGLSGGAIAGIVIGSVFGALIIAYGVCALLYKKKILKGAFFEKIYPFIKD